MPAWLQRDWCSSFVLALGHFLWQGTLIAVGGDGQPGGTTDYIVARGNTITGSIGVLANHTPLLGMLEVLSLDLEEPLSQRQQRLVAGYLNGDLGFALFTREFADDTDLPNDGNPCTSDACSAGVPSSR